MSSRRAAAAARVGAFPTTSAVAAVHHESISHAPGSLDVTWTTDGASTLVDPRELLRNLCHVAGASSTTLDPSAGVGASVTGLTVPMVMTSPLGEIRVWRASPATYAAATIGPTNP